MRRAARLDINHAMIVEAFEAHGCTVLSLAAVGRGVPDLLVLDRERLLLVEVKTDKGKLTPEQVKFHAEWPTHIVRSVEDVGALVRRRQ